MFEEFGINAGYVEELRARYDENPHSVDAEWRAVFERSVAPTREPPKANGGPARASEPPPSSRAPQSVSALLSANGLTRSEALLATGVMQGRVYQLLNAYRTRG